MSDLAAQMGPVLQACWTDACVDLSGLLAEILGFDVLCEAPAAPAAFSPDELLVHGGAFRVRVADQPSFLILLTGAEGFLPAECSAPDGKQHTQLATSASPLVSKLLPPEVRATQIDSGWVDDVAAAVVDANPEQGAQIVRGKVTSEAGSGELLAIWPIEKPIIEVATDAESDDSTSSKERPPQPQGSTDFASLPGYTRSLLDIRVQVTATLARSKQSLEEVLQLAPGAILQFNKTCEEMLELEVAGQPIAEGEAVKVGEKFGLRITSMLLPEERFEPIRRS